VGICEEGGEGEARKEDESKRGRRGVKIADSAYSKESIMRGERSSRRGGGGEGRKEEVVTATRGVI
jgi:hypothetical protein